MERRIAQRVTTRTPPLIIIDGDYDGSEVSEDLGINYDTDNVKAQVESAVDYQGLRQLLRNLGKVTHGCVQISSLLKMQLIKS